jgi:hypothetical protein
MADVQETLTMKKLDSKKFNPDKLMRSGKPTLAGFIESNWIKGGRRRLAGMIYLREPPSQIPNWKNLV